MFMQINKSLIQNLSICIGRLALASPEKVSTYLDKFIKPFCLSLRNISDSPEKRDSFKGLCGSIFFNPQSIMHSFIFFCDAICLFEQPTLEIEKMFQTLITSFTIFNSTQFNAAINSFPPNLRAKMITRFNLKL